MQLAPGMLTAQATHTGRGSPPAASAVAASPCRCPG